MGARSNKRWGSRLAGALASGIAGALLLVAPAAATIPPPGPQSGSAGLQGTVQTPAPKNAATIATPTNGQSFTKMPITVSGLCTSDLLVKIFANNVFVGSVLCKSGSYTIQVDLFDGRNDLVARVVDSLDQAAPDSNIVTVTYNNAQFATTGVPLLNLSSLYARRGANPGESLSWPITINGGASPYALSVDWGDGKPASLYSEQFAGTASTDHVYDTAGTYVVIVKATDKNGLTAFLQLVGQANGAVGQSNSGQSNNSNKVIVVEILWWPIAAMIPLLFAAFWLGRRSELLTLRRHLERPKD